MDREAAEILVGNSSFSSSAGRGWPGDGTTKRFGVTFCQCRVAPEDLKSGDGQGRSKRLKHIAIGGLPDRLGATSQVELSAARTGNEIEAWGRGARTRRRVALICRVG